MHCILVMWDVFCLCYFFASTMLFNNGLGINKACISSFVDLPFT